MSLAVDLTLGAASIFVGLDRLADQGAQAQLSANPALKSRVDQILTWLVEDGAEVSPALVSLVVALESEGAITWLLSVPRRRSN